MKTFDKQLKEDMFEAVGYRCCVRPTLEATQAHHIVPNTKINQRRWPLYLQSPMNLMPINHDIHMSAPLPTPPSDRVLDIYERWLSKLKGEV